MFGFSAVPPETIEMIKNDDPSFIENYKDSTVSFEILRAIYDHGAHRCLHSYFAKSSYPEFYGTTPSNVKSDTKVSPIISQMIHDKKSPELMVFSRVSSLKLAAIEDDFVDVNFPEDTTSSLMNCQGENAIEQARFILDYYVVPQLSGTDGVNYAEIRDPKIFVLLLENGINTTQSKVPKYAIENNLVEFIDILINKYGFSIDLDDWSESEIELMFIYNSITSIQHIMKSKIASFKNHIDIFLNLCSIYNCIDILSVIIKEAKSHIDQPMAQQALYLAAKFGRKEIVSLLIGNIRFDQNILNEALEVEKCYGYHMISQELASLRD